MRTILALAAVAVLTLQACTTTDGGKAEGAKDEKKAGAPQEESWVEKTGKNAEKEAKKLKEKGLPYYNACKAEIEKFCKAEEAKMFDCMKKNKDKFGPACKSALEAYMKDHK